MNPDIEFRLFKLDHELNKALDALHELLLERLRSMARSTGQLTRVDRL
jgi:hypothetical protein